MKHSPKSNSPLIRRTSAIASSTFFRPLPLAHCCNLWQVRYGGIPPVKSFQHAQVRILQRMPFRTSQISLHGLPRPSGCRTTGGIRDSRTAHCSSVNFTRFVIPIIILGLHETAFSKENLNSKNPFTSTAILSEILTFNTTFDVIYSITLGKYKALLWHKFCIFVSIYSCSVGQFGEG